MFLYEGILTESKTKMKTQIRHSELCIMTVVPLGEAGLSIKINLVGHHLLTPVRESLYLMFTKYVEGKRKVNGILRLHESFFQKFLLIWVC